MSLTIQLSSQLQTWISPLKVRVAVVAIWEGKTIVGERLIHHTIRDQKVTETDQWQQQLASRWLALGSLLNYISKNRNTLLPNNKLVPRKINIVMEQGFCFEGLASRRQVEVEYSNHRSSEHRPQNQDIRFQAPGYNYRGRCFHLIDDLAALKRNEERINFKFYIGAESTQSNALICCNEAHNKLMGFDHVGKRVLRIIEVANQAEYAAFYDKIAPRHHRKITRRKPNNE